MALARLTLPAQPQRAFRGSQLALVPVLLALCALAGYAVVEKSKPALLVLGLALVVALLAIFAELGQTALLLWPALGVIGFPLARFMPATPYVTFDRIWIGGMVALLLLVPASVTQSRASRRMLRGLGLLVVIIGVRTVLTPSTSLYPVRLWIDSLVLPLILFSVCRRLVVHDRRAVERIAFAMMVAGVLLALVGIGEKLIGFELASLSGSTVRYDEAIGEVRISGPYGAPEPYGLTLAICLAATMYWLLVRRRSGASRIIAIGIVGIQVIALFFTFFRVGWISTLVVMFTTLGLRPKRYARALGALAIVGAMFLLVLPQLEKVPAVSNRIDNTQNISNRFATYEQGWTIFKQHPLVGVGTTKYTDAASELPTVFVNGAPSVRSPHSSLFVVMAEDGVFGLLGLIAAGVGVYFLVRGLNKASLRQRSPRGPDAVLASALLGAAISYLIYSLSLTILFYAPPNEFFAIVLGVAAGRLDVLRGR